MPPLRGSLEEEAILLELYHAPLSPCAQKVRLVLHEKRLSYRGILIDLFKKENLKFEYLELNPNGVVPTLIDDGNPVIESTIICEYLEDRFPDRPLRPAEPLALAKMRLWSKRVDDKIHPASGVLLFGAIVRRGFIDMTAEQREAMLARVPDPARRERQADLIENGLDSARVPPAAKIMKDMADDIETVTSRTPWMLGERLSLTDFALAPYARVLEALCLNKVFAARPHLADWLARIKDTIGYREGMDAFDPPESAAQRAELLPSITPKLEPLF